MKTPQIPAPWSQHGSQPAQPATEEPAEVELIASGYEWTCPKETCAYIENKEIEITETVQCKKCKTIYNVSYYHHAHR